MKSKIIWVIVSFLVSFPVLAKPKPTKGVKIIRLDDRAVATIRVNKEGHSRSKKSI